MISNKGIVVFITMVLVFVMYGCTTSPFYQKQYAISGAEWKSDFQPEFTIDINDTQADYKAYFILRHDDAFPFSNIWIRLSVKSPENEIFTPMERVDLLLATPQGNWLGKNIGTIWEQKKQIPIDFKKYLVSSGRYSFKIEQIMRTDPLPSVLNVGLNIEKN